MRKRWTIPQILNRYSNSVSGGLGSVPSFQEGLGALKADGCPTGYFRDKQYFCCKEKSPTNCYYAPWTSEPKFGRG